MSISDKERKFRTEIGRHFARRELSKMDKEIREAAGEDYPLEFEPSARLALAMRILEEGRFGDRSSLQSNVDLVYVLLGDIKSSYDSWQNECACKGDMGWFEWHRGVGDPEGQEGD